MVLYRRFGTTYRSEVFLGFRLSFWTCWSLKMESTGCPETSVQNHRKTLRNIPEERRSYLTLLVWWVGKWGNWQGTEGKYLWYVRGDISTSAFWYWVKSWKTSVMVSDVLDDFLIWQLPKTILRKSQLHYPSQSVVMCWHFCHRNYHHYHYYYCPCYAHITSRPVRQLGVGVFLLVSSMLEHWHFQQRLYFACWHCSVT
jgi:hypothetical protein